MERDPAEPGYVDEVVPEESTALLLNSSAVGPVV